MADNNDIEQQADGSVYIYCRRDHAPQTAPILPCRDCGIATPSKCFERNYEFNRFAGHIMIAVYKPARCPECQTKYDYHACRGCGVQCRRRYKYCSLECRSTHSRRRIFLPTIEQIFGTGEDAETARLESIERTMMTDRGN